MRPGFTINRRRSTPPHGGLVLARKIIDDEFLLHVVDKKHVQVQVKAFTWVNLGRTYPYASTRQNTRLLRALERPSAKLAA